MLRIGTKLGLGVGALLAVCVVIGIVSYTQSRLVGSKIQEITTLKEPVNSAVYTLENNLVETAFDGLGYLTTGDRNLLSACARDEQKSDSLQQHYIDVADGQSNRELGAVIRRDFDRFHAIVAAQVALRDTQAQNMEVLLKDLQAIDRILTEHVQPSITADDPIAYRRLQAALEMEVNANAIAKALDNFLITGESQFEDRIREAERGFRHFFEVYQNVLLSPEEKQWALQLRPLTSESIRLSRAILDLERRRMVGLGQFVTTYRDLGNMLNDRVQTRTELGLAAAKSDVLQAGKTANFRILLALLLGLAFGVGSGILMTKNITRPLRHLASVMNAIARGDRVSRVDLKSNDELRALGEAFNLMTSHLVRANEELRTEIADRKRAQEALRISEERFRLSIEGVRDYAIFMLDQRGNVATWNAGAERLLGYREDEIAGKHFSVFSPGGDPRPGELLYAGSEGRSEDEGWRVRKDGSRFWANVVINALNDDDGALLGYSFLMRDTTEKRRLQLQLQEAARQRSTSLRRFAVSVQKAQEEERERISRELHDDLCQRLTGMKFRAEVLEDELQQVSGKASRRLHEFTRELHRAIIDVRRISSNLRPSVLDDFGLVVALKMLCKDFEKLHGIRASVSLNDDAVPKHVDPTIDIALYRIAQEALSNVAKHASASSVTVRLSREAERLRLSISDNGRGFDREDAERARSAGHGLGLMSMRERSEMLGGTFELETAHGKGTQISVTLPAEGDMIHEEDQNSDRG